MKRANLPDELFDLIGQKTFEELNATEKALVTQHLTAAEYDELRATISAFQEADSSLYFAPSKPPKEARVPLWKRIALYPIPLYQVAATLLLLLAFTLLWPMKSNQMDSTQQLEVIQAKQEGIPIKEDAYPDSLVFNL
ncbi:MAG: hypothetical protein AAF798_10315 [Bacteroidota bacterium]